ncbi:MAG: mechanosensitive ion channel family protein [Caldilineae bacterium]|nr:MAG: mechanosensitive ion channel family protein [Caldilineae bacterium]
MNGMVLQKIIAVVLILGGTGVAVWLVAKFLGSGGQRLASITRTGLDDAILKALRPPILAGVALLGLWLAINPLRSIVNLRPALLNHLFFLTYWFVGYLIFYRLTVNLANWYQAEMAHRTETTLDEQVLPFLRRVALIVITLIALIVLLGHFNVNSSTISAFITTLGIGSLAVALAAQTTLADTFSGFMIMIDRPFRIGDRIELVELDTWGDVQDIGLRSTRILTRDNRLVVIPNSVIGKNLIVNHSIPNTMFRVQTHVSVAYGVDIDHVRRVLVEAVAAQDWVMKGKPVEALFLEFQDSGLLFRVRCWIEHYVETRRAIDRLNTCVYKALTEAGIEIPFPQRVVYLHRQPEG